MPAVVADWCFRVASEAAFAADLNDFCAAMGYAPVAVANSDGTLSLEGNTIRAQARLDFDVFDIVIPPILDGTGAVVTPLQNRGTHVNVRGSLLPESPESTAIDELGAQIRGFFSSCPAVTNDPPSAFPSAGGQVWNATPHGSILIDPAPAHQCRRWA